jgi:hypothetical protein
LSPADYPASQAGGLTLMALLADVMAGRTKTRLTDQGIAYAALSNVTDGDTVDNEHVEQTAR